VAVKIVRQANKIALLGAPTSAAAMSAGHEGAPTALRAAGLVDRLKTIGYAVADLGDDPVQLYKPDEESPRARNLTRVLASLESLKPRVEQAVKSSALPLILAGDCTVALATVAGARRYFRKASMIYMDRDADLNTPATTVTGCVDGMVVSHLAGRGAAELVRFWGEPPLVREPDTVIFGLDRLDPAEQEFLVRTPMRHVYTVDIQAKGAAKAAQETLGLLHADSREFIIHLDTDVIAQGDFPATNVPGTGGLSFEDVQASLSEFAKSKNLLGLDVAQYNPEKDPDGSGAKKLVDLLVEALGARLTTLSNPAPAASEETSSQTA
jgi:arginase